MNGGVTTAALPRRSGRSVVVARVLGLYIAGAAGTIQLMDIVVDRAGLPDRVFAFIIVLAVIGLPLAAAAALMLDIAAAERRTPRPQRLRAAEAAAQMPAAVVPLAAQTPDMGDVAHDADADLSSLPQRLELALSYRRIARLHEAVGDAAEARPHRERFQADIAGIAEEIRDLIDE